MEVKRSWTNEKSSNSLIGKVKTDWKYIKPQLMGVTTLQPTIDYKDRDLLTWKYKNVNNISFESSSKLNNSKFEDVSLCQSNITKLNRESSFLKNTRNMKFGRTANDTKRQ